MCVGVCVGVCECVCMCVGVCVDVYVCWCVLCVCWYVYMCVGVGVYVCVCGGGLKLLYPLLCCESNLLPLYAGLGVEQVSETLHLRQIHLAVLKSATRKLLSEREGICKTYVCMYVCMHVCTRTPLSAGRMAPEKRFLLTFASTYFLTTAFTDLRRAFSCPSSNRIYVLIIVYVWYDVCTYICMMDGPRVYLCDMNAA